MVNNYYKKPIDKQPNNLEQLKCDYDIKQKIWCSDEDNNKYLKMIENNEDLPKNIYQEGHCFYELKDCNLSYEEKMESLEYKQLEILKEQLNKLDSIEKTVFFFVFLMVISIIIGIVAALCWLCLMEM